MEEVQVLYDLHDGSGSRKKDLLLDTYVVRHTVQTNSQKELLVLGQLVGDPFVEVRYTNSERRKVTARAVVQAAESEAIRQTLRLADSLVKLQKRCRKIPFLGRLAKSVTFLSTGVEFTAIPDQDQEAIQKMLIRRHGFRSEHIIFAPSRDRCP